MMQAVKPSSKKGASFSPSASGNNSSQAKQGGSNGKSIAQRVMDMATSSPNANDALRQQQTSSNNSVENDHEVETITNRLSHVATSNISPVNSQTSSSNNVNNNNNTCDVIRANSQSSLQLQQQRQQKHHDSSANVCISLDTRVPHPQKAEAFSYQPSASQLASRARDQEEVSYYNDTSHLTAQDSAACLLEPKQVGGSLDNSSKPRALLSAASSAIRDQKLVNSTFHMGATSCQQLVQQHHQQHQRHNHMQQQHTHHLHHLGHLPLVPQQANLIEPRESGTQSHHHYDDVDTYDLRYNNALVIEKEAARLHQREPSAGAGSSRYQEIPDLVYDGNEGAGEQDSGRQDKSATEQDSTTCQHSSSAMSIVAGAGCGASPKAKSAPATPCNVTPTAFHQNHQHPAGQAHKNPNTMPPDMRKNISSAAAGGGGVNKSRLLPAISMPSPHATFLDVRQQQEYLERAELALREKDYKRAVELFGKCISSFAATNQDKSQLKQCYIQRAEAHFQLAQYNEAIEDSMSARDLNPKWTKPYYLQGRSQFMIGRYADSLAVLSFGLTQTRGQDPQSEQLFEALVEAALKSEAIFGKEFWLKFNRLKALGLDKRPFLVVSLLGQEMLASGHCEHAAITLESALKLLASSNGSQQQQTYSHQQQRKLRSSVLSSISTAFCMLRDYDKAIAYMLEERQIERELENVPGQCRVLANLGHAYYKVRKFDDSLQVHREQLDLALKNNLRQQVYQALHAAGHVHAVKGDYLNAMQSHEHCVNLIQDPNLVAHDKRPYAHFRELLSVGYLHAQSNNLKGAEDRYIQASELLKSSQASQEQLVDGTIMVNFNLAYLALKRQTRDSYLKAKHYYTSVLEAAQTIKSETGGGGSSNKHRVRKRAMYEMRACHGLGQTCRLLRDLVEARGWFEKQLRLAETLKHLVGQSQALCNLGLISQHSDQQRSWKLFEKNLQLVKDNKLLKAFALSYMGLAYAQRNRPRESKDFYEKSLGLFKELRYCKAEERTIEENIAATS